jgi:hypothetical protein
VDACGVTDVSAGICSLHSQDMNVQIGVFLFVHGIDFSKIPREGGIELRLACLVD